MSSLNKANWRYRPAETWKKYDGEWMYELALLYGGEGCLTATLAPDDVGV